MSRFAVCLGQVANRSDPWIHSRYRVRLNFNNMPGVLSISHALGSQWRLLITVRTFLIGLRIEHDVWYIDRRPC